MRLRTFHYRWLAILWTSAILIACSIPAHSLSSIQPAFTYDKGVHFGLFAIFGGLWMRVLCPPSSTGTGACPWQNGLWLLLGGSLFAVGTEVYQHLMPIRRLGDPYDALADGAGLVVSILVYALLLYGLPASEQSSHVH